MSGKLNTIVDPAEGQRSLSKPERFSCPYSSGRLEACPAGNCKTEFDRLHSQVKKIADTIWTGGPRPPLVAAIAIHGTMLKVLFTLYSVILSANLALTVFVAQRLHTQTLPGSVGYEPAPGPDRKIKKVNHPVDSARSVVYLSAVDCSGYSPDNDSEKADEWTKRITADISSASQNASDTFCVNVGTPTLSLRAATMKSQVISAPVKRPNS